MTISLDYDATYTRDPDLWDEFITNAKKRGHLVICTTNRATRPSYGGRPEPEPSALVRDAEGTIRREPIPVIMAGHDFKQSAAEKAGYHVSIWIDDLPISVQDSSMVIQGELEKVAHGSLQ
jgi:hypothetical protein